MVPDKHRQSHLLMWILATGREVRILRYPLSRLLFSPTAEASGRCRKENAGQRGTMGGGHAIKLDCEPHWLSVCQVNGWVLLKDRAACAWGYDTPAVVWISVYLCDS